MATLVHELKIDMKIDGAEQLVALCQEARELQRSGYDEVADKIMTAVELITERAISDLKSGNHQVQ